MLDPGEDEKKLKWFEKKFVEKFGRAIEEIEKRLDYLHKSCKICETDCQWL